MKHVIGASVTLLTALAICILLMNFVVETASETRQLVQMAYEASDQNSIVLLVTEAERYWTSKECILGTVLRHDEIDDVGDSIAMLTAYAMRDDWDEFYGSCAALLESLSHIKEKERLLIHNLL